MIEHCRRAPGEAVTRAKVAERIVDHPNCAAAHTAGRSTCRHLRMITSTVKNLPETDRETAEEILLRAAEHVDPNTLARLARELEATVAPEVEAERAARRFRSRYLSVATTFAGMVHINGLLDAETGAALQAALAPLTAPQGQEDPRSAGQRRADALGLLARHALASDQLPDLNGARPVIQVTIDWDTLHAGIGTGRIGSPGHDLPLDVDTIRRLACDANILPVILGGPSAVLDIGRASKTWPLAIRRAAALRDQGCTFPGLPRPDRVLRTAPHPALDRPRPHQPVQRHPPVRTASPDRAQQRLDRHPPPRRHPDLHRPHRPHHQHLATTRHPHRLPASNRQPGHRFGAAHTGASSTRRSPSSQQHRETRVNQRDRSLRIRPRHRLPDTDRHTITDADPDSSTR